MKRAGNLFDKVTNIINLRQADEKARCNKTKTWGVVKHDRNREENLLKLQKDLIEGTFVTSEYRTKKIYEPKERLIYVLPYYPDRIVHHAIMNVLEPIWVKKFITNTYSCIKKRGIHKCMTDLCRDLRKYLDKTLYCLKLDIRKFYPSIDHEVLKGIIRRSIKDERLLRLLDGIIDSAPGVPIGNYLSQYFANLYLTYFDHFMKEEAKARFYYRYADDIVILSSDKKWLHNILCVIKIYLRNVLHLEVKDNYQIFDVERRGIDFVGYRFYHNHVLLRKSIKNRMWSVVRKYMDKVMGYEEFKMRISSYVGWMKYCDSKNILTKIRSITGIAFSNWRGAYMRIRDMMGRFSYVFNVSDYSKYFRINFVMEGKSFYAVSRSRRLRNFLNVKLPIRIKICYGKSKVSKRDYPCFRYCG